jgi:predicted transcriptional regulator
MGRKFAFEVGRIAKLPSYELDQLSFSSFELLVPVLVTRNLEMIMHVAAEETRALKALASNYRITHRYP